MDDPVFIFIEIAAVTVLGLAFGSFASALSWRIPRNISWIIDRATPDDKGARKAELRSRCPECGHSLGVGDLIPILSWVGQRGKCRYCAAPISLRYPVTELAALLLCWGIYFSWGLNGAGLFLMLAIPFLLALFLIDLDYLILPDQLIIILVILGGGFVCYQAYYGAGSEDGGRGITMIGARVLAALLYAALIALLGALMKFLLKKEALGLGDVKFFGVAGLWLGGAALPLFMIGAGVMGVAFGALWRLWRKEALFPFGPALILSFYITVLLQGEKGGYMNNFFPF